MRLLLDQNLSADAAMILRARGIDAIHAREAIRFRRLPLVR